MLIKLAYSPDTDDAFMVYALKEGLVSHPLYTFEFTTADIQTLNVAACTEQYDVTAISVGAYPYLKDSYELMPVGASIGDAFGPAIVVANNSPITSLSELSDKKIAIPGLRTSAYLAAKILLAPFEVVELPFMEIGPAVLEGRVDAGILIHELQLNYAEFGLRKLDDLGRLWFERYALPLPLGANAIKRSLGAEHIDNLNMLYRKSIEWGLANRKHTIEVASKRAIQGLGDDMADRYISMYVNEHSLDLNENVQLAIKTLLTSSGEAAPSKGSENMGIL